MFRQLKRTLVATLIAALSAGSIAPTWADSIDSTLPDMGTSAGSTLSIGQEMQMGDYYVRQLRGSAPLINDPLLVQYINSLGMRLVAHADSVKTPFHFYLVNNDEINAFAFFGGNVVLHSALFRYTDNESQLASVMAHEISHVTQRHLARAMEDQKRNAPLTWAGVLGSILLAMANPQAGMGALTGTLAGTQQGLISFTQQNEQEADRIGIQVLQRAGFDPQAMPTFLEKLLDQSRYSTRPPEILLTHPLPESRLSDARNRANQMRPVVVQSSEDFYMAKARTLGMYNSGRNQLTSDLLDGWSKGNVREQRAAQYGRALQAMEAKNYAEAAKTLQPLLSASPNNAWYLDLATDIDLGQNKSADAIKRLNAASELKTNPVLQLNLANAYLEGGQPAEAARILNRYTFTYKDDVNGWDLLAQAEAALNNRDQELAARAEGLALVGKLDQAITLLSSASSQVKLGSLQQARYDARIDQLRELQQRFKPYQKM
ncbi:beta-barrel assembly-enhancing protease [Kosakonia quasisacchari]|uniref:Beta-barrel assembly-enhancing protease n=1 Tax=Kosakonia quasisacchari TaxID=2529380 RepID=A0A4R0HV14_9ENTR|nr:beta-barrel assembly-enhancing protease [Kosakonia quasisacchari]TCC14284.1 beta-barrel assembly-enhancing protease [Kosakonia quasisacchari]